MTSKINNPVKGIGRMILCALSFAIMAIFVRYSCQTISSMEVVFVRSILGTIGIAFILGHKKKRWVGKNVKILVLRGVFGFIALSLHFYAIAQLGLGTAVILNYTSPIYVIVFAQVFLGEKTTGAVKVLILCCFVGLFLLAGPQFQAKPFAVLLGILSGIFAAIAYVLIRYNDDDESPYIIIFYFAWISTIGSLPFLISSFHWPNLYEWLGLIGVSIGAFFGQVWLTQAIQSAPVSFVLPFSYLTPVFTTIAGIVLFGESPSWQTVLGGLIIIASGVAIYFFREKPAFIPIEE